MQMQHIGIAGAISFARPKGAGIGLVIVSMLGAILGGTLVAVFMALALIGGVLAILGSRQVPQPAAHMLDAVQAPKSSKTVTPAVLAAIGMAVAVVSVITGANRSPASPQTKPAVQLDAAPPSNLRPDGELASIFELGSRSTNLQREKKEAEIRGKVVAWRLSVYEVSKRGNVYRIQTSSSHGTVGTFVTITARSLADQQLIEGLHTGDGIAFKGKIKGISMRNVEIEPAILWDASRMQSDNVIATPPANAVGMQQQPAVAVTAPHEPGEIQTVPTRFGDLSISPENELLYRDRLLAPVIQGNNNLDIVKTFQLGSVDAALVQDSGGTACPAQFYIVTTSPVGAAVTPSFGTCSDSIQVMQDSASITITMPGFVGPFESEDKQRSAATQSHVFRFTGSMLTENGTPIKQRRDDAIDERLSAMIRSSKHR
ncbi:hypothetical protein [Ralstonia insidiosa]|uniref:Uncharacterized protein n=1 Tax=Ralstonia insidiosa TaxID=190721 RepID=A0A848NZL9_9RALS|nr:hypothetical protein [Ralstonia insidiosa]NMV37884.1 hypothetical protein [Ralstonia insidiosa]